MPIRARSTSRPDHIAASSAEPPCPTSPDPPQTPQPPDEVCHARFPASGAETVYVVDYDQGDRDAIGWMLYHRGYAVEAFADCSAFLAAFRPDTRGCLLVDGLMLGVGGIDIIEHLRDECDEFPTIVMSVDASPFMVVQAMKAAAVDYIEKPIGPEELFSSIRQALDQSRDADGLSGFRKKAVDRIADLTPRQHQILKLVLEGHPSKNIATHLGISQRTVENHRARISRKTGAQSLPLMVHTAICASCRLVDRIRY
jgi:two-component system CheB/CheR fusion protein